MTTEEFYQELLGIERPWSVCKVVLDKTNSRVDVWLTHETGLKFRCPCCGKKRSIYDHAKERTWRHLDSCQYETHLHARLPRVSCQDKVRQTQAPWAEKRGRFTLLMERHCLRVLQECNVDGAKRLTGLSWDVLWLMLERAVKRGLSRKEKKLPMYMGIDEKSFAKRHKYETIVCDLETRTIEWVGDHRQQKTLENYFKSFTEEELKAVKAIAIDMWTPFIAAIKAHIPEAESKIVFDRFHVMQLVNKAVDQVRKQEHKQLLSQEDEGLKGTKYLWLSNEENIPEQRKQEFQDLKSRNLKAGRAWSIKESLRPYWDYVKGGWADKFMKRWYFWATHSRLPPVVKVAKTLKRYYWGIRNYFGNRITNALSEALNSKIETVKKMACGYRNRDHYKTAIYFHCGGLDIWPRKESVDKLLHVGATH